MSRKPPTRAMREHPDLDQLKRQAKELLEGYRASSPEAVAEVEAYQRTATPETIALHDAQFVLARSYGFESWPKLKAAVDGVTAAKLHEAAESGAVETARALLTRRPEIVDLGRGEMRALHMAVLRRDLGMTKLLLEFGADPDGGIWPKREATSPYVLARDRGYEEIVDEIDAARRRRGARGPKGPTDATRRLNRAWQSGNEDTMVASLVVSSSDDGTTIVGEVNSAERADELEAAVAAAVPDAEVVDHQVADMEDLTQLGSLGEMPETMASPDDPAVREAIASMMARHEERWVDEPVPALGGRTPREAVTDPIGRVEVEQLLASFTPPDKGSGFTAMNPDRLRQLLGL